MYPLSDPRCSNREAAKHCILLEEHLNIPAKRCPDCIQKHFLALEGYVEEGINLDNTGRFSDPHMARCIKMLEQSWRRGVDPSKVAHEVRRLRKRLTHGWLAGDTPSLHTHPDDDSKLGLWILGGGIGLWLWWRRNQI